MNETTLSNDERRCLQMWFRQAIAKLELEEVTNVMLEEYPVEDEAKVHAPRCHVASHAPDLHRT